MINNIFSSSVNFVNTNSTNIKTNNNKEVDKNNKNEKVEEDVTYESELSEKERKEKITSMLNQLEQQTKNFETLVSSIFMKQSNKAELAAMSYNGNFKNFYENLTVDPETAAKAKLAISEDGYYGVKQTSERILSFAKAVAGNDPEKLEDMRKAVEKGFEKAEKLWGGELPEISKQTYDKVMETFDSWQGISTDKNK